MGKFYHARIMFCDDQLTCLDCETEVDQFLASDKECVHPTTLIELISTYVRVSVYNCVAFLVAELPLTPLGFVSVLVQAFDPDPSIEEELSGLLEREVESQGGGSTMSGYYDLYNPKLIKKNCALDRRRQIETYTLSEFKLVANFGEKGGDWTMVQSQIRLHHDISSFGPEIQGILQQLSASQISYFNELYEKRRHHPFAMFLLALAGLDRFYIDRPWIGFLKLLNIPTGTFLIWWLIDIVTVFSCTRLANEQVALEVAKLVKELVDPNAPPIVPPAVRKQEIHWLVIALAVVAAVLVGIVLLLAVKR